MFNGSYADASLYGAYPAAAFCMRSEKLISFTVVGKTQVQPELFSTLYESVIVFGTCKQVYDKEKLEAFMEFVEKYNPEGMDQVEKKVGANGDAVRVYKISIEHITAKAKRLK